MDAAGARGVVCVGRRFGTDLNVRFRRGLIVGKFSPLHRGHELLIARALEACDELVIVSYSNPEYAGCERTRRAHWLAALFPQTTRLVLDDAELRRRCIEAGEPVATLPANDAPAGVHREFVGWLCRVLLRTSVDAVFTSEDYGDGFALHLGRYFRRSGVADARVRHVSVDPARAAVPISASAVRSDVHLHRGFLSSEVYSDFIARVCLLGGESSGKTTLARALAERLRTVWVPEYGRELWVRRAGNLSFEDMIDIGETQVAQERAASRHARRWLICDTSPLTTLFYCLDGFGRADPRLDALAGRSYDHVILCEPDFAFVQDGSRRDEAFRARQTDWYRRELARRRIAYLSVGGVLDERVRIVETWLASGTASVGAAGTDASGERGLTRP